MERGAYLSGRCSPVSRISRIRSRYWCSSCVVSFGGGSVSICLDVIGVILSIFLGDIGAMGSVSSIEGAIVDVEVDSAIES